MSEYFTGITFPQQKVTPSYDAVIRKAMLGDGVLTGCELSYSGSTLTMGAGLMIACGRQFLHTSVQNWAVTGATSGYARLLLTIDTTRASTKETFDQILDSIEYASSVDGFPELQQADINKSGTVYQMVVCVVSLGAGGITWIVDRVGVSGIVGKAVPRNLLDNSDFRNPVNQRGQTSYTAVGYTIDRWLKNAGTIITVDENGLNFVVNTAGNSAAFYQKIANANKFLGKKLTFVVYTDKGNILSVVEIPSTYPSSASYYGTVRTEYGYIQLMISSSTENQIYAIFSPSVNCTLYRAALYEGEYNAETLPEYHPKGFGAELVECRRYLKKSSKVYRSATSSDVAPGVNFEISMRIVPTVKIFDCDMNEGYVSVWTDDGISKVAVNSAPAFADGIFYIDAPVPAGCMVGYSYEASADL